MKHSILVNNFISKFLDIAICLTLYYFSLLALVFFSIFPEGRTWGLNVWAYHPLFFQVAVFVVGALAPLMFLSVRAKRAEQTPTNTHPRDISRKLVIIALTGVSAAGFYLLRGTTHFLGDGYTLLSELASDLPLIKGREIGESLLHIWLKNALPGSPGEAALGSFQVISIFSGVGFVLIVAYLSHRLTNQITKGILLSLGLLSGGYMLLFFGYVENYSMFLLSVTVFCLTGILAARSLISWRWALLALGAASLLHVLGLTMLPAALYLVVVKSSFHERLKALGATRLWLASFIAAGSVLGLFMFFFHESLFFQLSLVPIVAHAFTVEGYTLFSVNHILDILNLYILLLPALPILIWRVLSLPRVCLTHMAEYRFLVLSTLGAVGASIIFDPKFGMPRDWDLFAFAGVPLSLLLYLRLVNSDISKGKLFGIATLSISLGFLSLLPRVVGQMKPEIALAQFRSYVSLDKKKNRNAGLFEVKYFQSVGEPQRAGQALRKWNEDYPEGRLISQASALRKAGSAREAIGVLETCLNSNPLYPDAWANLGLCFLNQRMLDTALYCVEVADALNPYNPQINNYLGMVLMEKRELDRAETRFRLSLKRDTAQVGAYLNLAHLYAMKNDSSNYLRFLIKGSSRPLAPAWAPKELGDYYLSVGDTANASKAYSAAASKGFDSSILKGQR